eukprot:4987291-Amphidinium_carterae.1
MKELNKAVRLVKTRPQRMYCWKLQGKLRLLAYPDASYHNNADHSSQRGQVIFLAQPRTTSHHTYGSLIDYESHKIKRTFLSTTVAELYAFMKTYGSALFYRGLWCDLTSQHAEIHMRTDANNL